VKSNFATDLVTRTEGLVFGDLKLVLLGSSDSLEAEVGTLTSAEQDVKAGHN